MYTFVRIHLKEPREHLEEILKCDVLIVIENYIEPDVLTVASLEGVPFQALVIQM
jgi:hypothetical protein